MSTRAQQSVAYNADIETVFAAVMQVGQLLKHKVELCDPAAHLVHFSTKISAFSWGERMNVSVYPLPDGRTGVDISSDSNLGAGIGSGSRNRKNVEKLIEHLNNIIQ